MEITVRSQLLAGVALIGAGAIAMTAVVPTTAGLKLPESRTAAIEPAAFSTLLMKRDPIDQIYQLTQTTLDDSESIIDNTIADPTPILQQVLENQVGYTFDVAQGLASSSQELAEAVVAIPATFGAAAKEASTGNYQAALTTLQDGLAAGIAAGDPAMQAVQTVLQTQYATVQRLVQAVPEAGMLLVNATLNAASSILGATIDAGTSVVTAAASLNAGAVATAVVQGAINVADVTEQDTIGQQTSTADNYAAGLSDSSISDSPSIAVAAMQAKGLIVNALAPEQIARLSVLSKSAVSTPTVSTPTVSTPTVSTPTAVAASKVAASKVATSKVATSKVATSRKVAHAKPASTAKK
jgi:hypothetical protein